MIIRNRRRPIVETLVDGSGSLAQVALPINRWLAAYFHRAKAEQLESSGQRESHGIG